jgi:hypothetical protein
MIYSHAMKRTIVIALCVFVLVVFYLIGAHFFVVNKLNSLSKGRVFDVGAIRVELTPFVPNISGLICKIIPIDDHLQIVVGDARVPLKEGVINACLFNPRVYTLAFESSESADGHAFKNLKVYGSWDSDMDAASVDQITYIVGGGFKANFNDLQLRGQWGSKQYAYPQSARLTVKEAILSADQNAAFKIKVNGASDFKIKVNELALDIESLHDSDALDSSLVLASLYPKTMKSHLEIRDISVNTKDYHWLMEGISSDGDSTGKNQKSTMHIRAINIDHSENKFGPMTGGSFESVMTSQYPLELLFGLSKKINGEQISQDEKMSIINALLSEDYSLVNTTLFDSGNLKFKLHFDLDLMLKLKEKKIHNHVQDIKPEDMMPIIMKLVGEALQITAKATFENITALKAEMEKVEKGASAMVDMVAPYTNYDEAKDSLNIVAEYRDNSWFLNGQATAWPNPFISKAPAIEDEQAVCLNAADSIVGAVRSGISLSKAEHLIKTATEKVPDKLDSARNGIASPSNIFFDSVLEAGVTSNQWSKKGNHYTYTCGDQKRVYVYDVKDGFFLLR